MYNKKEVWSSLSHAVTEYRVKYFGIWLISTGNCLNSDLKFDTQNRHEYVSIWCKFWYCSYKKKSPELYSCIKFSLTCYFWINKWIKHLTWCDEHRFIDWLCNNCILWNFFHCFRLIPLIPCYIFHFVFVLRIIHLQM